MTTKAKTAKTTKTANVKVKVAATKVQAAAATVKAAWEVALDLDSPEADVSPEIQRQAALREKYGAVFDRLDRGGKGGLKKGEFAQAIRSANEEFTFLDDDAFGPFVREAWTEAQPNTEGLVGFAAFAEVYDRFQLRIEAIKAKDEEESRAKAATTAAAAASMFGGDNVWECPMTKLMDALAAASSKQKTPLLIDMTGQGDGYTVLETFFSYSCHQILEAKKMVVEVNLRKTKTVEEAMEEARTKLIMAMRRGYSLLVLLSNSAPPLKSKFTSPTQFPYALLEDAAVVQSALGTDANIRQVEWTRALLREADKMHFVHKDFNVVVVTKFSPEDYVEFLQDELPLDSMQHIKVVVDN